MRTIYDRSDFVKYCTEIERMHSPRDICFIALHDGTHTKQIQSHFFELFQNGMHKISSRGNHFLWIDANVHRDLLKYYEVDMDTLPAYVAYRPYHKIGFKPKKEQEHNYKWIYDFAKKVLNEHPSIEELEKNHPLEDLITGDFKTVYPQYYKEKEPENAKKEDEEGEKSDL